MKLTEQYVPKDVQDLSQIDSPEATVESPSPNMAEIGQPSSSSDNPQKLRSQLDELDRQLNSSIFAKKDNLPHLEALYSRTKARRDAIAEQITEIEEKPRREAEAAELARKQEIVKNIREKTKQKIDFFTKLRNTPEPSPYQSSEDRDFIEAELAKIDQIIPIMTEAIVDHRSARSNLAQEMEAKIRNYEKIRHAYYEDLIALEEKERDSEINQEITDLIKQSQLPAELENFVSTEEVITELINRGYRPQTKKTSLSENLLAIVRGQIEASKQTLLLKFSEVKFDSNGEPLLGLWGRITGKIKTIKNTAEYQKFKLLLDFGNFLTTKPQPIETASPKQRTSKKQQSLSKLRPILASGVAAITASSNVEEKTDYTPTFEPAASTITTNKNQTTESVQAIDSTPTIVVEPRTAEPEKSMASAALEPEANIVTKTNPSPRTRSEKTILTEAKFTNPTSKRTEQLMADAFSPAKSVVSESDSEAEDTDLVDNTEVKPQKESKKVSKHKQTAAEIVASLGLNSIPAEMRVETKAVTGLSAPELNQLTRRLQKLGFSSPDQSRIISTTAKLIKDLSPDSRAKKLASIQQMDYQKLRKLFRNSLL